MGRVSLILTLEELPLFDCDQFWGKRRNTISAFEKLKVLSVMGGVPRYLEEIRPTLPAEENIRQLCFETSGILFNEFDQIFSDLFSSRNEIYKRIIGYLANSSIDRNQIAKLLNIKEGGVISGYLNDLVKAGFVTRDFSWRIHDGKTSKLSHFRLSDNYLRFYLKYILPNKRKIEAGGFKTKSLTSLPGFSTIMGLQFENLVLKNKQYIHRLLEIRPEDIISEGPYFQRGTKQKLGCQIDYLIQTKFDSLYICEIKFSKYEVKSEVIEEVKSKIVSLKRPKYESDFFTKIINFEQLLKK